MTAVDLTITILLSALAMSTIAVYRLAARTGHGWVIRVSGLVPVLIGIGVFSLAPAMLPLSFQRFIEPLAFGTAFGGLALLLLWIATKRWPDLRAESEVFR